MKHVFFPGSSFLSENKFRMTANDGIKSFPVIDE